MPSPTCEVKDGAGAYVATTNGVDVTPTNTITIRLADSNVDQWEIQCITTDDTNVAATIQAALTIDSLNKTASFTAPSAGAALRFRSRVQGGIGPDGQTRSSYTTTFGIYTLTAGGYRVIAADETTESDATFGWIVSLNDVVRNPPGGFTAGGDLTGTGTSQTVAKVNGITVTGTPAAGATLRATSSSAAAWGTLDLADTDAVTGTLPVTRGGTGITSLGTGVATFWGTPSGANLASALTSALPDTKGGTGLTALGTGVATFLGTPSSANLLAAVTDETGSGALVFGTAPTISAPTLSSTPVLSGASTSTSNNPKGTAKDVNPVNVQTTDATVTTLDSFTIASNSAVAVSWLVTGIKSDSSAAAGYSVTALFKNAAGTVAQIGTTGVTILGETNSAWDCTADNSTTTIRLRVTGVAATTIQWTAILTSLTVIP